MIVKLRRDLFIDGSFFKASRWGTEVPDEINGLPVVAHSDKDKVTPSWALPKDAEILSAPLPRKSTKDEPLALSQVVKKAAAPKSFVDVMKDTD